MTVVVAAAVAVAATATDVKDTNMLLHYGQFG